MGMKREQSENCPVGALCNTAVSCPFVATRPHSGFRHLRWRRGPVTNLQVILVSDELRRPHAKHGHRNPGDALPLPPVFLKTIPTGRAKDDTPAAVAVSRESCAHTIDDIRRAASIGHTFRSLTGLACAQRRTLRVFFKVSRSQSTEAKPHMGKRQHLWSGGGGTETRNIGCIGRGRPPPRLLSMHAVEKPRDKKAKRNPAVLYPAIYCSARACKRLRSHHSSTREESRSFSRAVGVGVCMYIHSPAVDYRVARNDSTPGAQDLATTRTAAVLRIMN